MTVSAPGRRRVLLYVRHLGLLPQHYEGVLRELAALNYELVVYHEKRASDEEIETLSRQYGNIRIAKAPTPADDSAGRFVTRLRFLTDGLRYKHPDYPPESSWLFERVAEGSSPGVRRWIRRLARLGPQQLKPLIAALVRFDRILPPSGALDALVGREAPDLIVVSPAVWVGSPHADVLKAAARRGIPSAAWIPSWDNLTNKGLLRCVPDRVFVWNEAQRAELGRYHGIPHDRVAVTGAQTFDHWFASEPSLSRDEFCASVGLDSERPFILFLGSSRSIAPDEPAFFERWLESLRGSGQPELEGVQILVRAHPRNVDSWLARGVERLGGVALSIPALDASVGEAFYAEYRNVFEYATVAVGVNTSAMVEAAIFGLPVCVPLLRELAEPQRGTLHFAHLLRAGGGLLHTAPTLEDHAHQLARLMVREPNHADPKSAAFVADFLRPAGVGVSATEVFVLAMRELIGQRSSTSAPNRLVRGVGVILIRSSRVLGAPLRDHPFADPAAWFVARAVLGYVWIRAGLKVSRKRVRRLRTRLVAVARRIVRHVLGWASQSRRRPGAAASTGPLEGATPRVTDKSPGLTSSEHEGFETIGVRDAVEDEPGAGGGQILQRVSSGRHADRP